MITVREKIEQIEQLTNNVEGTIALAVEEYIDEGKVSFVSISFTPTIVLWVRNIEYHIYANTYITDVKPIKCTLTIPSTMEEMTKRLVDSRMAQRCAVQAHMILNYLV